MEPKRKISRKTTSLANKRARYHCRWCRTRDPYGAPYVVSSPGEKCRICRQGSF